jgi:hypothetical protein
MFERRGFERTVSTKIEGMGRPSIILLRNAVDPIKEFAPAEDASATTMPPIRHIGAC